MAKSNNNKKAQGDEREAMLEQLGIKDRVFFISPLDGYYFNRQVSSKKQRSLLAYQDAIDKYVQGKKELTAADQLHIMDLQKAYFEFAAEIIAERWANVGSAAPTADDLEEKFNAGGVMSLIGIFFEMDGDPNA